MSFCTRDIPSCFLFTYPKKSPKPKTDDKSKPEDKKAEKKKKVKANSDENGYTLVLRKLQNNSEVQFGFVKDFIFSKYGHTILERYGMSETLMNISNPYTGERRPGSVGFAMPILGAALISEAELVRKMSVFEYELKTAMFCTGCASVTDLQRKKVWRWRATQAT